MSFPFPARIHVWSCLSHSRIVLHSVFLSQCLFAYQIERHSLLHWTTTFSATAPPHRHVFAQPPHAYGKSRVRILLHYRMTYAAACHRSAYLTDLLCHAYPYNIGP